MLLYQIPLPYPHRCYTLTLHNLKLKHEVSEGTRDIHDVQSKHLQ